jgi:hypothetical protein
VTNKAKRRAKAVMVETGCGMRAAYNIMAKRTACSRAGHPANREPNGAKCTDCGAALAPGKGDGAE